MRRADRLFQIIQILRRSRRPVTADALAEELETYLAFLADPATPVGLAARSSHPRRLFEALSEVGFLDADGREVRTRRTRRPTSRRVGGRSPEERRAAQQHPVARPASVTSLTGHARVTAP